MANLPFDIANFNLINFANIYPDVMDSTPKTIEYQYKDANGDIQTKAIANRGEFKQQLWDDVGGALGQFNRTFYVDAENGNDNNTGSSSAPFKTIKKAVDSVPVGGYGVIYLSTDNNIIDNDIVMINKTIIIKGDLIDANSTNPAIKNVCYADSFGNATYGFIMTNSYLEFANLTIKTSDYVDSSKNESFFVGLIKRYDTQSKNKVILNQSSVLIGDTDFIRLSDRQDTNLQVYSHDYKHSVTDKTIDCVGANNNGYLINNEKGALILSAASIALGTKNDNSTSLAWTDLVTGIVKDANGVVLNVLSNINFE